MTTFIIFFLSLFRSIMLKSISLPVTTHFFINSCIFLTIFHHSSCSYGNTFSNIHFFRVTALLQVKDNWMGQPTSVPYFPLGNCASNCPTSLIANYFNIKKYLHLWPVKSNTYNLRKGTAGDIRWHFLKNVLLKKCYRNADDYSIPDFI